MKVHQGLIDAPSNEPLVNSYLNLDALAFDPQKHFELTLGPYCTYFFFFFFKPVNLKKHYHGFVQLDGLVSSQVFLKEISLFSLILIPR